MTPMADYVNINKIETVEASSVIGTAALLELLLAGFGVTVAGTALNGIVDAFDDWIRTNGATESIEAWNAASLQKYVAVVPSLVSDVAAWLGTIFDNLNSGGVSIAGNGSLVYFGRQPLDAFDNLLINKMHSIYPADYYAYQTYLAKNYSGWIFGSEKDFKWTQTLPGRSGSVTKSHFYNPIMQNEEHIKWMREYIGSHIPTPIYSYIVFGEHCTLKNLNVIDNKYHICKLDNLYNIVSSHIADNGIKFSKEYVDFLFIKFYPLTQRSDAEKMQHIEKINAKKSNWK